MLGIVAREGSPRCSLRRAVLPIKLGDDLAALVLNGYRRARQRRGGGNSRNRRLLMRYDKILLISAILPLWYVPKSQHRIRGGLISCGMPTADAAAADIAIVHRKKHPDIGNRAAAVMPEVAEHIRR